MAKPPTEPEALRREIEQTRAELGETVEALAARADVKARAQEAVDDVKARAQEAVDDVKQRVHDAAGEARTQVRGAIGTFAYQVGKQRERVAALNPRVRTALAAVAVGVVALLVIRTMRDRRRAR